MIVSRDSKRYDSQGSIDLNPLIRLKDALEGAQKNTNRMLTKLDRFEKRLEDLHSKMKPVQETTDRYSKAKDNIASTLQEVGKTYEYFRITSSCEPIIKQGLVDENRTEYFEALTKLSNAKTFFESHREIKSSSSVLQNIDALFQQAIGTCTAEFEQLLNTATKSVSCVNSQYELETPLTQSVQENIKSLCDAFDACRYTGHYSTYQTLRIARMKTELKELETAHAHQFTCAFNEDPYQKGNHPFKEFYTLAYWLVKSEYQMWGSTLPTCEESLNAFVAICDASLSEITRVLSPMLTEDTGKAKVGGINPLIKQSKMLLLRLDILDMFLLRYDDFRDLYHPDARHESSASLGLKDLRQKLVEACIKGVQSILSAKLSDGFQAESNKKNNNHSLEDFIACDQHPITGNILYCCKELGSYSLIYRKSIDLANIHHVNAAMIPGDVDEVVCGIVENLIIALEARAEHYDDNLPKKASRRSIVENSKSHSLYEVEDKGAEECIMSARKHIFLVNNFYPLINFARDKRKEFTDGERSSANNKRSYGRGSISVTQRIGAILEKVDSRLNAEIGQFCETIAMSMGLSSQDMNEFNTIYEKDKNNQHRILKAKFAIFNTGLDALLAQQGEWRVSSATLRETLSQNLLSKVVQVYAHYFATYSTVKFSKKHMGEYLKYTPAQLENYLRNFFGRT